MARIFKQKYVKKRTVRGPDGKSVMVRTKTGKLVPQQEPVLDRKGSQVLVQTRKWYVQYRDSLGVLRKVVGYTDKQATEQLAAELERWVAQEQSGLIDRFAEHRKRALGEHVDDWQKALLAKGNTTKHADLLKGRVSRLLDACGFRRWSDISASRVQAYLAEQRGNGLSAQTSNFYLQAVKQFCRWMVRDGRAPDSALAHLQGVNVKTDRRHDRRALKTEELRKLLATTESGPTRFGMTGPQRALLYTVALETGLRASELRSLTPTSFDLDARPPTITVEAGYSKHRRQDTLPIRESLAGQLRGVLGGAGDGERIFNMPPSTNTARMFRADLADVGIPYRDDAGRVADVHALRHTFVSNLVAGGVHPKLAQALARHSTITLTMDRYTHTVLGEQAEALTALPDLSRPDPNRQKQLATGTDDRPVAAASSDQFSPADVQVDASDGQEESLSPCLSFCLSDDSTPSVPRLTPSDTEAQETGSTAGGASAIAKGASGNASHAPAPNCNRRGRDSNPRDPCGSSGFQDRRLEPLGHLSQPLREMIDAVRPA